MFVLFVYSALVIMVFVLCFFIDTATTVYLTRLLRGRIRCYEFIKLKDISKELIISPPLKYAPIITLTLKPTLKPISPFQRP